MLSLSRGTRLDEFSPINVLFALGYFMNITLIAQFHRKSNAIKFGKIQFWATFWALFSLMHLVALSLSAKVKTFEQPKYSLKSLVRFGTANVAAFELCPSTDFNKKKNRWSQLYKADSATVVKISFKSLIVSMSFLRKKLPSSTLAGFDLTTHKSSLLGGRRRRCH
jgi:hypothetical protein